jgi:hypothetical protein
MTIQYLTKNKILCLWDVKKYLKYWSQGWNEIRDVFEISCSLRSGSQRIVQPVFISTSLAPNDEYVRLTACPELVQSTILYVQFSERNRQGWENIRISQFILCQVRKIKTDNQQSRNGFIQIIYIKE